VGTGTPDATETSTPTTTPTIPPSPSPTNTATATASPSPTQTATSTGTPQPCLLCTATAQIILMATTAPTETEVPPTSVPSLPPTVGPGGNPRDYATAGFVFGLIAIAAFIMYFSGAIVSKRTNH
jgi:hypothetical protein